jgi:hypothetical protein
MSGQLEEKRDWLERFLYLANVATDKSDSLVKEFSNSIEDFLSEKINWFANGLTKLEVINLLKMSSVYEAARIDTKSYQVLNKNFPNSYPPNEDAFYEKFEAEIERDIEGVSAQVGKELYKMAFRHYFGHSQSLIHSIGVEKSYFEILIDRLSILGFFAERYPFTSTMYSCMSEMVYFLNDISLGNVANLSFMRKEFLLGFITGRNCGKYFFDWRRGKISTMNFFDLEAEYFVNDSSNVTFGPIESLVGNLIFPGLGLSVGTSIGSFISKLLIVVRKSLDGNQETKKLKSLNPEQLYEEALNKLNLKRESSTESVKEIRRKYLISFYRDLNDKATNIDKSTLKLLFEQERSYRIIENYRKPLDNS